MEQAFKRAILRQQQQPSELQEAIQEVCRRLDNVQERFEMETDNDLIEACIYEMESLRAQYRYLLRQARERGVSSAAVPLWKD